MAAAIFGAAVLLAGCGSPSFTAADEQGAAADEQGAAADSGVYQSADGTTTIWPAGERLGPLELAGTGYDGTAVDVADWRGEVVVINIWFAACPPCQSETPDLVSLAEDTADQGVHVVGLNPVDDAGSAEPFLEHYQVSYPVINDSSQQAIAALQGVTPISGTPTTIVLDRSGMVLARIIGAVNPTALRTLVDDAVAETATDAGAAG